MCITNSGQLAERQVWGEVLPSCHHSNTGFLPYRKALGLVMKSQPKARPCALKMRNAVADGFGAYGINLRFFTAIGSALDQFHGIDGIFVCGQFTVTVDFTLKPGKEAHRADLVVSVDEFDDMTKLARKITLEFARKIRERRRG